MDVKTTKELMSAMHESKRIMDMLLPLPKGMTQRHILIIDSIWQLTAANGDVKISDVSDWLRVTKPSVTKLLKELEQLGVVVKAADSDDKRVIHLRLTELGQQYYDLYVDKYNTWVGKQLNDITKEDVRTTVATVHKLYLALKGKRPNLES